MKFSLFLFFFFNTFCFEILDYNLEAFQNLGPYNCSWKNHYFTFNAGKIIPNASLSGQDDCVSMDLFAYGSVYMCYGEFGRTSYSPLPDGSDGVLVTSKGPNYTTTNISLTCSVSYLDNNCNSVMFSSNESFGIIMPSPYGCKGTGPGARTEKPNRRGVFGIVVLSLLLSFLVVFFLVGFVYAYIFGKKNGQSLFIPLSVFVCFFPLLVADGVKFIFSSITNSNSKSKYSNV